MILETRVLQNEIVIFFLFKDCSKLVKANCKGVCKWDVDSGCKRTKHKKPNNHKPTDKQGYFPSWTRVGIESALIAAFTVAAEQYIFKSQLNRLTRLTSLISAWSI
jgi:hypothetical protein